MTWTSQTKIRLQGRKKEEVPSIYTCVQVINHWLYTKDKRSLRRCVNEKASGGNGIMNAKMLEKPEEGIRITYQCIPLVLLETI